MNFYGYRQINTLECHARRIIVIRLLVLCALDRVALLGRHKRARQKGHGVHARAVDPVNVRVGQPQVQQHHGAQVVEGFEPAERRHLVAVVKHRLRNVPGRRHEIAIGIQERVQFIRAAQRDRAFTDGPFVFAERFRKVNGLLSTNAPIARTPKEIVWTLNKAKLYRYTPVVPAEKRHKIPLLLVFAIINRPSILDLRPGYSFVEFMVKKGYDVYLLDWGVPGQEDSNMKLDDYALEYLPRAIRKVKSISGSREFSMLGWCIGAVLTTIYAALRPDDGLRNLLLLTAPLDFSNRDALTLARLTDEKYFNLDRVLSVFGNMPGEMIDFGSRALKPVENLHSELLQTLGQP